jgi:hypothetical protein
MDKIGKLSSKSEGIFPGDRKIHGGWGTSLYNVWKTMKARCSNSKLKVYAQYGGRGIKVDPSWESDFSVFRSWAIEKGYQEGLSLDREDNDGNYEPSNCRWATRTQQNRNRRITRHIIAFGEKKTVAEWTEDPRCVVPYTTLIFRLNSNWLPEDIIVTPVYRQGIQKKILIKSITKSSLQLSDQDIEFETWKSVPDWERYDVSDLGRIRSGGPSGKILKPYRMEKTGKLQITLCKDGKPKKFYVDRLVLMAHVGLPPENMESCHFPDPNPSNCRLSNLRWDTKSENSIDKSRLNKILLDIINK